LHKALQLHATTPPLLLSQLRILLFQLSLLITAHLAKFLAIECLQSCSGLGATALVSEFGLFTACTVCSQTHRSSSIPRQHEVVWFDSFHVARCQHDSGRINGRSQISVHTDERTQVHSARSTWWTPSSTNRGPQARRVPLPQYTDYFC